VADPTERLAELDGRDVFDVNGELIGSVSGLAFPRRKFGNIWLLVKTADVKQLVIPAEEIKTSRARLELPYPKRYVEGGPIFDPHQPFTHLEERRLRLHYGLDFGMKGAGCDRGCGLCHATRRRERAGRGGT
jgi:hypothetical protein